MDEDVILATPELLAKIPDWRDPKKELPKESDNPLIVVCHEWGFPDTLWVADCGMVIQQDGTMDYYLSDKYYSVPHFLWHVPSEVIKWTPYYFRPGTQLELPL